MSLTLGNLGLSLGRNLSLAVSSPAPSDFSTSIAAGDLTINNATGTITLTVTTGPYATVDVGGGAGIFTSTVTAVEAAPVLLATQPIAGTLTVGNLLTADDGLWLYDDDNGALSVTHQWQADTLGNATFADLSGATATTYTTTASEAGDDVRCELTGTQGVLTPVVGYTAAVSVAASVAPFVTDGTQSVSGFTSETAAADWVVTFSGLQYDADPLVNSYLVYFDDGGADIYLRVATNGRAGVFGNGVLTQATFADRFQDPVTFDLRTTYDGGAGTIVLEVDYNLGSGWQTIATSTGNAATQDVSDMTLFADNTDALGVPATFDGVLVTVDGVEVLDLNPASAATVNSGTDNDARSFTTSGTFGS